MKPARSKQLRKTPGKWRSGSLNQDPVEVYCRLKPVPSSITCLKVISPVTIQMSAPEGVVGLRNGCNTKEIQYIFKQVFGDDSSQKDVFNCVGLPLITQLITGKNGLLFTYGVTGSGKTYTMTGEPQDGGIMPRCLDVIFNTISGYQTRKFIFKPDKMNGFDIQDEADAMLARQEELLGFNTAGKAVKTPKRWDAATPSSSASSRAPDGTKVETLDTDNAFAVFITYIEIYNNSVHDLLDDSADDIITRKMQNKVIREDGTHNMYVHGVTELEVKSSEEAFDLFYKGQRRKRIAHTNLNEESSRSHSIFTVRLVQAPLDMDGETVLQEKKLMTVSQLSLVDLAGSERTNRTKNKGQRLREAGNINNSLMTLRTCLEMLRENQQTGSCKMVPYRDSKLTHLFKNYFDGEGQVRMIVCVNPKAEDYDETVHVLKFAEMTQEVQVTRPNPRKLEIGLTPGRRRAGVGAKATPTVNTEVKELNLDAGVIFNLQPPFPPLTMVGEGWDDERTLIVLEKYLEQRLKSREAAVDEFKAYELNLRKSLVKNETDFVLLKQELAGLKGTLDQERRKVSSLEAEHRSCVSSRQELDQRLEDRDQMIRLLQQSLDDKEMVIHQQSMEKDKVKEKYATKYVAAKDKLRREMRKVITKEKDDYLNHMRDRDERLRLVKEIVADDKPKITPRTLRSGTVLERENMTPLTPLSTLNTHGTLYMPPHVMTSAYRRGVAVCNPRHRRSRSAGGGGDVWLDHRPANPVELATVLQPVMKRRKSVTKLTDVKDIVNSKTSRYCLTTQEQDTDGELETKLYKGDVIPTCGGGAQVVLSDVELLKQLSPTSEAAASRKRSFTEETVQSRCAVSIEGKSKRSKN